jgi:hypothetical protein
MTQVLIRDFSRLLCSSNEEWLEYLETVFRAPECSATIRTLLGEWEIASYVVQYLLLTFFTLANGVL